jgi:hypothetical protein
MQAFNAQIQPRILCVGCIWLLSAGGILVSRHRNIIHIAVENLLFRSIGKRFFWRCGFGFFQRDGLSEVAVAVSLYLARIEAEDIFVTDAIGNAIAVQLIAEDIGGGIVFANVLTLDWRYTYAHHEPDTRQSAVKNLQ